MNAYIVKTYRTETSHIVRNAVSIRCSENFHGHSYVWETEINGPVKENGMVLDFKELQPIREFIDKFDHATVLWEKDSEKVKKFFMEECKRTLIMKKNTTAENMASLVFYFIAHWLRENHPSCICAKVKVHETITGCAIANQCDSDDVLIYCHNDKS